MVVERPTTSGDNRSSGTTAQPPFTIYHSPFTSFEVEDATSQDIRARPGPRAGRFVPVRGRRARARECARPGGRRRRGTAAAGLGRQAAPRGRRDGADGPGDAAVGAAADRAAPEARAPRRDD